MHLSQEAHHVTIYVQETTSRTVDMDLQMKVAQILKKEISPAGVSPVDAGHRNSAPVEMIAYEEIGIVFIKPSEPLPRRDQSHGSGCFPSYSEEPSLRTVAPECEKFQRISSEPRLLTNASEHIAKIWIQDLP
jgi:hypothetical protein